ncbi:hypothetical protein STEG23_020423, partial [Scotinomys teguina]
VKYSSQHAADTQYSLTARAKSLEKGDECNQTLRKQGKHTVNNSLLNYHRCIRGTIARPGIRPQLLPETQILSALIRPRALTIGPRVAPETLMTPLHELDEKSYNLLRKENENCDNITEDGLLTYPVIDL